MRTIDSLPGATAAATVRRPESRSARLNGNARVGVPHVAAQIAVMRAVGVHHLDAALRDHLQTKTSGQVAVNREQAGAGEEPAERDRRRWREGVRLLRVPTRERRGRDHDLEACRRLKRL